jgi:hypothetical protein
VRPARERHGNKMRAEAQNYADQIKQALDLLRRFL